MKPGSAPHTIAGGQGFGFLATPELVREYATRPGTVFACVDSSGYSDYQLTVRTGKVRVVDGLASVFVESDCGGRCWEPIASLIDLAVGVYPPSERARYQAWYEQHRFNEWLYRNANPEGLGRL